MINLLPYKISERAVKQLKRLRRSDRVLYDKLLTGIEEIRRDPSIGEAKKGDLKGFRSLDIHHLKTNYELTYTLQFDDKLQKVVLVVFVGTRENFYAELKRYLGL